LPGGLLCFLYCKKFVLKFDHIPLLNILRSSYYL
jgi:hypothetical protein